MKKSALAVLFVTVVWAQAQPAALLRDAEALALYKRSTQLIESTSAAVPGLARAAGPVVENVRQAIASLEAGPRNHSGQSYAVLINLRTYLALSESTPKPYPFPEAASKQFAELREAVDRAESHFRALLELKESQVRSPDRDNLRRYAESNERLAPRAAGQPRVVFLGDSITDGWRLNEYFSGREFVNRGIGGQITSEMLARMKADVIDLKPDAVVILAGTNDIGRGVPLSTIKNNLTMIADLADVHKIKLVFASVLPVSDYHKAVDPSFEQSVRRPPARIKELNDWLQSFCKQRGYTYVDYFAGMVDSSGFLKAELADDGLHPNAAGYRIMAPLAMDALEPAIAPPKVAPRKKRFGRLSK